MTPFSLAHVYVWCGISQVLLAVVPGDFYLERDMKQNYKKMRHNSFVMILVTIRTTWPSAQDVHADNATYTQLVGTAVLRLSGIIGTTGVCLLLHVK